MENKLNIYSTPNPQITIVGRDVGKVSASKIESLVDFSSDAAGIILTEALENNTFVKLVTDSSKIKTLVILDNGKVYPSTFKIKALAGRIRKATSILDNGEEDPADE